MARRTDYIIAFNGSGVDVTKGQRGFSLRDSDGREDGIVPVSIGENFFLVKEHSSVHPCSTPTTTMPGGIGRINTPSRDQANATLMGLDHNMCGMFIFSTTHCREFICPTEIDVLR